MSLHSRRTCPLTSLLLLALLALLGLACLGLGAAAPPATAETARVDVHKWVDLSHAQIGQTLSYVVMLTNTGTITASLRLTDANPAPPYTAILSETVSGGLWISHTGVISWDGALAPGLSHTLSFSLLVQGCPPRNRVSNTAYVSDRSIPGSLPIASAGAATAITCSTYLPSILKEQCFQKTMPPFGLEIAALHEFEQAGTVEAPQATPFPSLSAALQESGASWVRMRILWSELEPANSLPSGYRWSYYDDKVSRVLATGARPLVVLADNPAWAATTRCGPIDLVSLDEFIEMLTAVVARYSRAPYNIHYWEIYNEPDGTWTSGGAGGLGCWGNYAGEYVQLLSRAYPAIKAIDPEAQVLLGGIAYDWFVEYGGPFNRYFIDDVLAAGGASYFDLVNFHYFPDFHCEWDEQYGYRYGRDLIAKTNYIRERLGMYGVQKPVVCSELAEHGYPDDPASLQKQARYVVQGYARAAAAGLPFAVWYALDTPAYDPYQQGLLFDDMTPKPAFVAYQVLVRELGQASLQGSLPSSDPNVEGYIFQLPCGQGETTVLWTNPVPDPPDADPCSSQTTMVDPGAQVAFAVQNELAVVGLDGTSQTIVDGSAADLDGLVNNQVVISVTVGPVLVTADP